MSRSTRPFAAVQRRTVFVASASLTAALLALLTLAASAFAQDTAHFITLVYWPVDAPNWYVVDYPDTAWTWDFLGLNPGKGCPPYLIHDRAESTAYWRNPSIPEEVDWEQASHGNRWVSCYRGHGGTDIIAPAFSPVYAAADGDVVSVRAASDDKGPNGLVTIKHHREIAGFTADWTSLYLHLENNFPVMSGHVVEGQLIGFVGSRGTNTHLHFEMRDLWDCQSPCIVNPWGPTFYFFDDDSDHRPDPASSVLRVAPSNTDLVRNGGFVRSWQNWMALSGTGESIQYGWLRLSPAAGEAKFAGVQQLIPVAIEAGSGFEIDVLMANPGDAPQSVWVSLRDATGFGHMAGCAFSVPARSGPAVYWVRGIAAERWSNLVLLVSAGAANPQAEVMIDNIGLTAYTDYAERSCSPTR